MASNPRKDAAPFSPAEARHFDRVNDTLQLTDDELALLTRNGFVITDRLAYPEFRRAYAWLYWQDLPVLVTTDALLHSIHRTYDEMLKRVEDAILRPQLLDLVRATFEQVQAMRKSCTDERLRPLLDDLSDYLHIPLALLDHTAAVAAEPAIRERVEYIRRINEPYYTTAPPPEPKDGEKGSLLRRLSGSGRGEEAIPTQPGVEYVTFFGLKRPIDFSAFTARGHYVDARQLQPYFEALSWLGVLDFRLVDVSPAGVPQLQPEQIAAAHLLRDALAAAGQQPAWEKFDDFLKAFLGHSDNMTLYGLEAFLDDANLTHPADVFAADADALLQQLLNDTNPQQLRGQLQPGFDDEAAIMPHTVSFLLVGQRFTLESFIIEQLVYDKLVVNGNRVRRAYPNPLDVMAALGNDRAYDHLADEFAQVDYRSRLDELRAWVESHSHEFWEDSFYSLWLTAIRSLAAPSDERFPRAMRSPVWADKLLHTQLASWTQLRHDNVLYVKQPRMLACVCEYPAGYVEPYPAFYKALGDYARLGGALFAGLGLGEPPSAADEEGFKRTSWAENSQNPAYHHYTRQKKLAEIHTQMTDYFSALEIATARLETLAHKELNGEAFSEDDNLFLRSIVVRKYVGAPGYGGWTEEHWDGWYNDLLPFGDKSPELITDIHVNVDADLGPQGVQHVATGHPVTAVCVVETTDGPALFAGPAFTYYEHLEKGYPPRRLTDDEWQHKRRYSLLSAGERIESRLQTTRRLIKEGRYPNFGKEEKDTATRLQEVEAGAEKERKVMRETLATQPQPPAWTASFRLPCESARDLQLPTAAEDLRKRISPAAVAALDAAIEQSDRLSPQRRYQDFAHLVKMIDTEPETVLQEIEGLTPAMLAEITQALRDMHHL